MFGTLSPGSLSRAPCVVMCVHLACLCFCLSSQTAGLFFLFDVRHDSVMQDPLEFLQRPSSDPYNRGKQIISQERIENRIEEQGVGVAVPQILDEVVRIIPRNTWCKPCQTFRSTAPRSRLSTIPCRLSWRIADVVQISPRSV